MTSSTADQLFERAFRHHLAGDIKSASSEYLHILTKHQYHADTLHHMGIVKLQKGEISDAVLYIQRSVDVNPNQSGALSNLAHCLNALGQFHKAIEACKAAIDIASSNGPAWVNLGNAQKNLGLFGAARVSYRRAIEIDPNNPGYIYNLAVAYLDEGDFEKAAPLFIKCLSIDNRIPQAHNNLGICLLKSGNSIGALKHFEASVDQKPDYAEAWNNRSIALNDIGRHQDSLDSCNRAIELKPDYTEAWNNRSNPLNDLGRHEESLATCMRAIELRSDYTEAWINRGDTLCHLKRFKDAVISYDRAIELNPTFADAWNNRGNALHYLERYEEALSSYERAIELRSEYAEAWNNRGDALGSLQRYDQAEASYDRALELKQNFIAAQYNKGLLQLRQKQFFAGFENYLKRWETKDFNSQPIRTNLARHTLTTKSSSVLLWAEQGLGDEIFYSGMLANASNVFPKITLSADKRLHAIFKRSFPHIDLIATGDDIGDNQFGSHAPMGDLGYLLRLNAEEISKSRKPFLSPDPKLTARFRNQPPFTPGKLVCGLSWRSANKDFGEAKSIPLSQLKPLSYALNANFVSLQYGDVDSEIRDSRTISNFEVFRVSDLDPLNNIDGLLSLIDACDVVVTTSNVTAHLAGAIGKQACILVPYAKGKIWYWHLHDSYSFWYPSLKVFYQEDPRDWSQTIQQAAQWLEGIR